MIVEVIAVGTELLLGQIVNTNLAHIGARLAERGLDAHFQQVVGDNAGRMESAIRLALDRADAIVVTGGIGPTQDDITREAICAATGLEMEHSDAYEAELRERFAAMGRSMPEQNVRQADHPRGAELLANPKGTAPGLALDHRGTLIFAMPGVPSEMHTMLADHVMPRLLARAGIDEVIVSRVIRTWGRGESTVAELLDDVFAGSANPSVAFLASSGEVKVRLTAKAGDAAAAERLIAPVQREVEDRLGSGVFGVDEDTIERVVLDLARRRGWTVGTAESATAGMVAGALTSVPGASEVFRGGVVAYAADLKASLLGVADDVLDQGVVSEDAAVAMAEGGRRALDVHACVAVTGYAGPDAGEQPPGTMIVAVATPEGARARTLRLPGDRERVRTYTTTAALHLLRLALSGDWWGD